MKTKKSTLYTIVILLIIFLPLAVYGTYNHIKIMKVVLDPNPNHEFLHNGSLYFYDESGELNGTYQCVSANCGYPKTIIDDEEYGINYFNTGEEETLEFVNDDFAIIEDNQEIFVYSLKLNQKLISFEALKNYHTKLANNVVFAKSNGKWGILSLDSMTAVLPYEYDFIGLPNKIIEGTLVTDTLIVLKDDNWSLIKSNGEKISSDINSPIINFSDKYILTKNNEIYDFEGNKIVVPIQYQQMYFVDKYTVFINNNLVIVYEDLNMPNKGTANISNYENIEFDATDGVLSIYLDGTMGATIDLNR